jgi:signal transduction histidine kinase
VRAETDLQLVGVPHSAIEVLAARDAIGLSELYRRCFAMASDNLRAANSVISAYYKSLLEKQDREKMDTELRQLLVHDLRSPLAICETGIGQLIDQRDKFGALNERQVRILKRSRRSALFLQRLINEVLEVGRVESAKERVQRTTVRALLHEAVLQSLGGLRGPDLDAIDDVSDFNVVRAALADGDFHIQASDSTLDAVLEVDPIRLLEVLMNLISNAVKHAPGWIALRVTETAERITFAVVDRGPGIPEAYRQSIFELYFQSQAKREGIRRGFGLGLAGAARLVAALGGSIRAEPGDNGVGTRLVFDVPRQPRQ